MKVVEALGVVADKLIELVRTVVMSGWGPVFRLVVVLAAITMLVVIVRVTGSR